MGNISIILVLWDKAEQECAWTPGFGCLPFTHPIPLTACTGGSKGFRLLQGTVRDPCPLVLVEFGSWEDKAGHPRTVERRQVFFWLPPPPQSLWVTENSPLKARAFKAFKTPWSASFWGLITHPPTRSFRLRVDKGSLRDTWGTVPPVFEVPQDNSLIILFFITQHEHGRCLPWIPEHLSSCSDVRVGEALIDQRLQRQKNL